MAKRKAESGERKAEDSAQQAAGGGQPTDHPVTPSPPRRVIPDRPEVEAEATRCPKCDSTQRERITRTTVQKFAGLGATGRPFTHIVRRWTRCVACGQARVDRTLENRKDDKVTG